MNLSVCAQVERERNVLKFIVFQLQSVFMLW